MPSNYGYFSSSLAKLSPLKLKLRYRTGFNDQIITMWLKKYFSDSSNFFLNGADYMLLSSFDVTESHRENMIILLAHWRNCLP